MTQTKRRLQHEWWLALPKFKKAKPDLYKITGREALNLYIKKHGGQEQALKQLINLNGTADTHTVFCGQCGGRITKPEEAMVVLVRGRVLCWKHQVSITNTIISK